jgi:MFS family permease
MLTADSTEAATETAAAPALADEAALIGHAQPWPTQRASGPRRRWLNRNVVSISLADLMADANYEMVLAILPLFLVINLGAPALGLGLVEGVGDACLAVSVFLSGYYGDRVPWRKRLASGGYAVTVAGLSTLALVTQWTQVIGSRSVAWIGRGTRKPIRSAMLAGSVDKRDLGKAFGLHEAMDTLGALIGPGIAFLLLVTGHSFQTVFLVAVIPGVLSTLFFATATRDPRTRSAKPRPTRQAMPATFWRLALAIGTFGLGNFAPVFFTLRALEMLRPELSVASATTAAVAFFLGFNAVGSLVSYPGGWLIDRVGGRSVLTAGYLLFAAGCGVAAVGHGVTAVILVALLAGSSVALVNATESACVGALVDGDHRGTAFGIMAAINGLGDLVASVVVGILWTVAGGPAALAYAGVLAVAGTILLVALTPRRELAPG